MSEAKPQFPDISHLLNENWIRLIDTVSRCGICYCKRSNFSNRTKNRTVTIFQRIQKCNYQTSMNERRRRRRQRQWRRRLPLPPRLGLPMATITFSTSATGAKITLATLFMKILATTVSTSVVVNHANKTTFIHIFPILYNWTFLFYITSGLDILLTCDFTH